MIKRPRKTKLTEILKDSVALVISPDNRKLAAAWLICFMIVLVIGLRSSTDSSSFVGIADSRESVINFDYPVNVEQINVISGQPVKKGDLLAQVDQVQLETKMQEMRSQLRKLVAEQNLITEMGSLGSLNKSRTKSNAVDDSKTDPLAAEIEGLQQQLASLESRERASYVFAQTDGIVGTISFKKGETVAPYAPLITISPNTPSYIDAFLHESLRAKIELGQQVTVTSMMDSSKRVEGTVASMGSRIVELPTRIGRVQSQKMWGREILIEIPDQNPFLLGEKVEVSHPFLSISFPLARAGEANVKPKAAVPPTPQLISVPIGVKNLSSFEPSGAAYIKDLKKFVIASDDTDKDYSPYLFLMGHDGVVDNKVVRVSGISDVHDVETVLQADDGYLYLLSSQTPNKKGEIKESRNRLIRVKRNGMEFSAAGTVNMRPLILTAMKAAKDADLKSVSGKFEDLEIEAGFLSDGHLNVALKKPLLKDGSTLVFDLGPIGKIVDTQKIAESDFRVAHKLVFPATAEKTTRVSDIAKIGNNLIITTVSKKPGRVGRLWTLNMMSNTLKKLEEYPDKSPEAVAFDADNKELMVLFDEKDEPALFMRNTSIKFQ